MTGNPPRLRMLSSRMSGPPPGRLKASDLRQFPMLSSRMADPQPGRVRQFFMPGLSSFPGIVRTTFYRLFQWGSQAVAPVNTVSSWGGVAISPELALSLSTVWACAWRYALTISTLPLFLYRTGPSYSSVRITDHPLARILYEQPNANMSASSFWQSLVIGMMLWGGGYAKKQKIDGRIVGLEPWRPEFVTVYRNPGEGLRYRYAPNGMEFEDLPAEDVFAVLDRTIDGLTPVSRIKYGSNSMGDALSADRASALSWKNGLRASGVLSVAQWLKKDQRELYRERLAEFMGQGTGASTDKQGGIMIVENATKFEPVTMKPADVELLASRRHSIEELCRWYDVPPILIGHSQEGQTMWGSGVEQIILGWLKLGLGPLLVRIEQEVARQLLTPAERADMFCKFNVNALLRGDATTRSTFLTRLVAGGILTPNEARALEELEAKPGGDDLLVQSAMVRLESLGDMIGAADAGQLRAALRGFLGVGDGNERNDGGTRTGT